MDIIHSVFTFPWEVLSQERDAAGMSYGEQFHCALFFALVWGLIMEVTPRFLMPIVMRQKWWPNAIRPQKQLLYNFGFPQQPQPPVFPEGVSDELACRMYCTILPLCTHHIISGLCMVPVLLSSFPGASNSCDVDGWHGAPKFARNLFIIGTLNDVGYDMYDMAFLTLKTFYPYTRTFGPAPLNLWILCCVLHHPLALTLVMPLNSSRHVGRWEFHAIAASLLLGAGFCYITGNYKFTLNVQSPRGFRRFKWIVVLQTIVILFTRLFLFFPAAYSLLSHLHAISDWNFFYGGCIAGGLIGLFNLVMVGDVLSQAAKWLPRKMPKTMLEVDELNASMAELAQSPSASATLLPSPLARKTSNLSESLALSLSLSLSLRSTEKGSRQHRLPPMHQGHDSSPPRQDTPLIRRKKAQ